MYMSTPEQLVLPLSPVPAVKDVNIQTRPMHVSKSTFLGGLDRPFHRWFRLTPSFGPELVRDSLAVMETTPHSTVLDPFAGAGTTLIEATLEGHRSVGFELNPMLHYVCRVSTTWDLDADALARQLKEIGAAFHESKSHAKGRSLADLDLDPPPIHNIHRWWRDDVLRDILLVRQAIDGVAGLAQREFFHLALAGVLVPDLTNVTLGRLQLHFIDRTNDDIRVWDTYSRHAEKMIRDVDQVSTKRGPQPDIFNVDSSSPPELDIPPVDRVVTSPPYPNRYSYVWNTRPHLYMLRLISTGKEAADIDLKAIGGTWGSATSVLGKGVLEPSDDVVDEVVSPLVEEIQAKNPLMGNYVMKYFNLLSKQIQAQDPLLDDRARLCYVVGCSRIAKTYVETDTLLAKVFEGHGYSLDGIDRFRRRHSGKDLHESAVFARK